MREIHCQCGATFSTEEEAPTWARCPRCGREIHLPAGSENDQALISSVLPYRAPDKPIARAGPFMIGFFGTLGFTVVAFIVLFVIGANFFEAPPGSGEGLGIICSIFIASAYVAIGLMARHLSREPRWSGIGRGVIVGICLSMIVMIPCAGAVISETGWR